ncbi:hypothetical protein DIPPA_07596 [Diplonema papillatum]|nr:hypothetical protein DIPPA_07643 [Diplonema papillatum]KAJ9460211.1 hypothetical protein DIPPA_07596 [Diplonema papillatum]
MLTLNESGRQPVFAYSSLHESFMPPEEDVAELRSGRIKCRKELSSHAYAQRQRKTSAAAAAVYRPAEAVRHRLEEHAAPPTATRRLPLRRSRQTLNSQRPVYSPPHES